MILTEGYNSKGNPITQGYLGDATSLIAMNSNPVRNAPPLVLLNGSKLGMISQIDQMTDRFINVPIVRSSVRIELVSPFLDSEIRYETNGKNPNDKSKLYKGALMFDRNITGSDRTVIKARIYDKRNSNLKSRIIRIQFNIT